MVRFILKTYLKTVGNRPTNRRRLNCQRKLNGNGCDLPLLPLETAYSTVKLPKPLVEVIIENCKINLLYLHLLDLDGEEIEILREWYNGKLYDLQKSIDDANDYLVEGKSHES